jgi:hypothetical protein
LRIEPRKAGYLERLGAPTLDDDSDSALPHIERVAVDPEVLRSFKEEGDFTGLSVELLKEVASHVCVAGSLLPGDTKAWGRNQAVLGGLLVRLYKMLSAVLDQTCQHRRETTFIFLRLAFECCINIRYLIGSPESTYASYVAYSLRHERQLFDRIQRNIKARGGESLPIERRMLASIQRAAEKSGIPLEHITPGSYAEWKDKNLFERADAIGWGDGYLYMVGGPSHSVHGNWQDLLEYHLDESENGFQPEFEWHRPRPQPLMSIGLLTLTVLDEYLVHFVGDEAKPVMEDFEDLRQRLSVANHAHEAFLSARQKA